MTNKLLMGLLVIFLQFLFATPLLIFMKKYLNDFLDKCIAGIIFEASIIFFIIMPVTFLTMELNNINWNHSFLIRLIVILISISIAIIKRGITNLRKGENEQ